MKVVAVLVYLAAAVFHAKANLYLPHAKLAGESVHVRLLKETAEVTAVFEFDEWITRDAKVLYFPIFSADAIDPLKLLARTGLTLEIQGRKIGIPAPCAPPDKFKKLSGSPRVCWFAANLEELAEQWNEEAYARIFVKVIYAQPLIQGSFYYLPVIVGSSDKSESRSWRYQMLVHSETRIARVTSKTTDYEQLADAVVVYLKDGNLVEVR